MDAETAQFLLAVSGSIILLVIGAVGYFVTRFLKAVDQLAITVTELKTCFANQKDYSKEMAETIKEHSNKIYEHDTEIKILKGKVK